MRIAGFYRWLYKDAGYKVSDHFSIAGSLYRRQGTSFPIDVIVIEGRGETQLKLPGVQPPRIYESYENLKEVLINAIQRQQFAQPKRDSGITLQRVHTGTALDPNIPDRNGTPPTVDNSVSSRAVDSDRRQGGVLLPSNTASGVVDRTNNRVSLGDIPDSTGERRGVLGSGGDQSIFADVREQRHPVANSPTDGRTSGNELPGVAAAMLPNGGNTISSHSTFDNRGEFELPGRHESNRLAGMDERGGQPAQLSRLNAMPDVVPYVPNQEPSLENQIPYRPRSKAFSLNTLIPTAALKGLDNAFNKIEVTTGVSIDEYVRDRLNEPSLAELFKHYAAEQIDSLALSIYNYEFESKATLIGHDTGIGKTRIVCGLARYAQQHGMVAAIVTVDPVLYDDILARDAVDTGNRFNPLITNNDLKITLTSSNGEKIGEINTPKNQNDKIKEYARLKNIGEHDCVFTTYGQLTGPASVERRQLLSSLAPQMFLILDESHKAGGARANAPCQ